eukprot:5111077-Alexandrium_andersonii.AAC.1
MARRMCYACVAEGARRICEHPLYVARSTHWQHGKARHGKAGYCRAFAIANCVRRPTPIALNLPVVC